MKHHDLTHYVYTCLSILLTGIFFWLAGRYILSFLVALLLAFLLASLAEPLIGRLCKRGVRRPLACGLVVPPMILILLSLCVGAAVILGTQLRAFLEGEPALVQHLSESLEALRQRLAQWQLGELSLWQYLQSWLTNLDLTPLVSRLAGLATGLPGFLLGTVFVSLAAYHLAAQRTVIFPFLGRQLDHRLGGAALKLKEFLFSSVARWLKAQAILLTVTFGILAAGLWFLGQSSWLLIALVIALLDALPVLGSGLFMVPWALVEFLLGNWLRGLELLGIYAMMEITRTVLEPRVLGVQLGLPPFVALCSLYLGFTLFGVAGMLLMPAVALSLIKLQEWGYLKLWK